MAFTTLIITALIVTVASASFSGPFWDNNNDPFDHPMISYKIPTPRFPPLNFPNFPNIPQINFPQLNFPTLHFPVIKPPTPADILNQKPIPGTSFDGIGITSHSDAKRGEDGKVIRTSGATIVTNTDGVVTMHQVGNRPPPLPTVNKEPPPSGFKSFKMHMPSFKPLNFQPIKPMDPNEIRQQVPGKGETFTGNFKSVSVYTNEENGVKTSGGKSTSLNNDNGKVDEETVAYHEGPQ